MANYAPIFCAVCNFPCSMYGCNLELLTNTWTCNRPGQIAVRKSPFDKLPPFISVQPPEPVNVHKMVADMIANPPVEQAQEIADAEDKRILSEFERKRWEDGDSDPKGFDPAMALRIVLDKIERGELDVTHVFVSYVFKTDDGEARRSSFAQAGDEKFLGQLGLLKMSEALLMRETER